MLDKINSSINSNLFSIKNKKNDSNNNEIDKNSVKKINIQQKDSSIINIKNGNANSEIKFLDNNPPTKEEIKWALDLEQKVKNGYRPTEKEINKYQNISERVLKSDIPPVEENKPNENKSATKEEIKWALDLEQKVKNGYNPTSKEVEKYQDIFSRETNK